jgi:class 3 adenylate cyclase/tetratricopeptide (TPR) repeat protein
LANLTSKEDITTVSRRAQQETASDFIAGRGQRRDTLLDELRYEAESLGAIVVKPVKAAVLIADVSGFTALTATLEARHGVRGADILSAMMDKLLGALAKIAEQRDGLVVDVVGDAIHALWIADETRSLEDARLAAAYAATEMLDYAASTAETQPTTPIRIGVACGDVDVAMIGGHDNRWEGLALGRGFRDAGDAVARAPTNCCRIGGAAEWQITIEDFSAQPDGENWWLLRQTTVARQRSLQLRLNQATAMEALAWTAELRFVTVMFCRLISADEMARATPAHIHRLTRIAQEVITTHGGLLDKIHADDKGVSIVVAFGVQGGAMVAAGIDPSARGGTSLLSIVAAFELRRTLNALGIETAIGIATGKVRVGVGDTVHGSCHTMYGHAVNFAARCMQACHDEILCDEATHKATSESVSFFAPEARILKGLEGTGSVFGISGIKEDRDVTLVSDTSPIAGRHNERAAIRDFVDTTRSDRARVLILEGENGTGKSRLASFAIEQAVRSQRRPLICRAGLLGTRTPLFGWRDPLTALLKRRARAQKLTLTETQIALVEAAGGVAEDVALIGSLFARDAGQVPQNDQDGDPSTARGLRAAVAAKLIGDRPRLIVLEDAQWLDDISIRLARDLIELLPALQLMVLTRQPVSPSLLKIGGNDSAKLMRVSLGNLSRDETAILAANVLGTFDPKHPFVDWLYARSSGNPMFCRVLIALLPTDVLTTALSTPGAWRRGQAELELADMPATIEGALLVRFANLPTQQLGLLKAASVLGGTFDSDMLKALGTPTSPLQIEQDLGILADSGVIARSANATLPNWRFADELTRTVVYESLPKQLQRELHRRAASYLEQPALRNGLGQAAQIAHHWLEADVSARAFSPLRRAGVEAKQAGSYASAVSLWKTALSLIDSDTAGERARGRFRRAVLHRDLAVASWRLGEPATTIEHCYASLEGLWPGPPKSRMGWAIMLARESIKLGWHIAVPHRRRTPRARDRAWDWLRLNNAARLIEAFYFSVGALPAAAIAVYAARTAERLGEVAYAARPYGFLGYLAGARNMNVTARFCFNRSRRACMDKKDWSSLAQSVNGEAMYHLSNGRWKVAIRRSKFVATLSRKINRNADIGSPTTFIGLGYLMAGSFGPMREAFEKVEAIAFAKSNDHYLLFHRAGMGQVELAEGQLERAEALLLSGRTLAARVRDLHSSLIVEGLLATAKLRLGKFDEVAEMSAALITQAEATPMVNFGSWYGFAAVAEALVGLFAAVGAGQDGAHKANAKRAVALLNRFSRIYPVATPLASLFEGQYDMLCGHSAKAVRHWQNGIRAADPVQMKYDLARLYDALANAPTLDETSRTSHRLQAIHFTEQCGVKSLPPLPLTLPS